MPGIIFQMFYLIITKINTKQPKKVLMQLFANLCYLTVVYKCHFILKN